MKMGVHSFLYAYMYKLIVFFSMSQPIIELLNLVFEVDKYHKTIRTNTDCSISNVPEYRYLSSLLTSLTFESSGSWRGWTLFLLEILPSTPEINWKSWWLNLLLVILITFLNWSLPFLVYGNSRITHRFISLCHPLHLFLHGGFAKLSSSYKNTIMLKINVCIGRRNYHVTHTFIQFSYH